MACGCFESRMSRLDYTWERTCDWKRIWHGLSSSLTVGEIKANTASRLVRALQTAEQKRLQKERSGKITLATLAPLMAEWVLPEQAPGHFSEALHRYWGYESFRPGQENIVRSIA